jgi:O-methyltransferase
MLDTLIADDKFDLIRRSITETHPLTGALAELGVYRGGNALRMAQIEQTKKFYLFDTFTGIPEKSTDDVHDIGDFSDTCVGDIVVGFLDAKIELLRINFRVGIFPYTALGLEHEKFSLVHLDADQYETTLSALDFFYPRLQAGGIIILDDFDWPKCPGIRKAIDDYFVDDKQKIYCTPYCQAYLRKEPE